jgi:dipeptidyl-peptidase-3
LFELQLSLSLTLDYPNTTNMTASIDSETLKQYLADSPPSVVPLAIKPHFEALNDKEKLYAHHISM